MSAPAYDDAVSHCPDAALKYLDEDDGEIVTVGSSIELAQRLEEPVTHCPVHTGHQRYHMPTLVGEPQRSPISPILHTFDIDCRRNSLSVWQEIQAQTKQTEMLLSPAIGARDFQSGEADDLQIFSSVSRRDCKGKERDLSISNPRSPTPMVGNHPPGSHGLNIQTKKRASEDVICLQELDGSRTRCFEASDPPRLQKFPYTQMDKGRDREVDQLNVVHELRETVADRYLNTYLECNLTLEGKRQAQAAGNQLRARTTPSRHEKGNIVSPHRMSYQNRWASYNRPNSSFSTNDAAEFLSAYQLPTPLAKDTIRQVKIAGDKFLGGTRLVGHSKPSRVSLGQNAYQSRWPPYAGLRVELSDAWPASAVRPEKFGPLYDSEDKPSLLNIFEAELARYTRNQEGCGDQQNISASSSSDHFPFSHGHNTLQAFSNAIGSALDRGEASDQPTEPLDDSLGLSGAAPRMQVPETTASTQHVARTLDAGLRTALDGFGMCVQKILDAVQGTAHNPQRTIGSTPGGDVQIFDDAVRGLRSAAVAIAVLGQSLSVNGPASPSNEQALGGSQAVRLPVVTSPGSEFKDIGSENWKLKSVGMDQLCPQLKPTLASPRSSSWSQSHERGHYPRRISRNLTPTIWDRNDIPLRASRAHAQAKNISQRRFKIESSSHSRSRSLSGKQLGQCQPVRHCHLRRPRYHKPGPIHLPEYLSISDTDCKQTSEIDNPHAALPRGMISHPVSQGLARCNSHTLCNSGIPPTIRKPTDDAQSLRPNVDPRSIWPLPNSAQSSADKHQQSSLLHTQATSGPPAGAQVPKLQSVRCWSLPEAVPSENPLRGDNEKQHCGCSPNPVQDVCASQGLRRIANARNRPESQSLRRRNSRLSPCTAFHSNFYIQPRLSSAVLGASHSWTDQLEEVARHGSQKHGILTTSGKWSKNHTEFCNLSGPPRAATPVATRSPTLEKSEGRSSAAWCHFPPLPSMEPLVPLRQHDPVRGPQKSEIRIETLSAAKLASVLIPKIYPNSQPHQDPESDNSESSGDFFNRMVGLGDTRDQQAKRQPMSFFHSSPVATTSRLVRPFDPLPEISMNHRTHFLDGASRHTTKRGSSDTPAAIDSWPDAEGSRGNNGTEWDSCLQKSEETLKSCTSGHSESISCSHRTIKNVRTTGDDAVTDAIKFEARIQEEAFAGDHSDAATVASIQRCVEKLKDLDFGNIGDGGVRRLVIYAQAAEGDLNTAIDLIEEEQKAYHEWSS